MRPVADVRDKPMFHGIEMNVIHVPLEILFVADRMFPKAPLPQREIAIAVSCDGASGIDRGGAEMTLNPPPAT